MPNMLIILFLFAVFRALRGVPLPVPTDTPDNFSALSFRDISSHLGARSVNDIFVSCFATILACTCSAIHPNIPAPTECWWTQLKCQMTMMICALLAPELITVWALRKHIGAHEIMREYNHAIFGENAVKRPVLNIIIDKIMKFPGTMKGLFQDSTTPNPSPNGPKWTAAHGFFLQMGGFMLSDHGKPMPPISRPGKGPIGHGKHR